MNREIELLRAVEYQLDAFIEGGYFPNAHVLLDTVKELLAQPEQEPVAWFYERQIEGFTERTMSVGFEENFDGVTIPLYLEPPRRETLREHIDNHKAWYQIGYEVAKQELEPLCRHSIDQAYMASNFDNYYDCFDDGIKFAERCHGITGVGDE
jgi:hypothetical protein